MVYLVSPSREADHVRGDDVLHILGLPLTLPPPPTCSRDAGGLGFEGISEKRRVMSLPGFSLPMIIGASSFHDRLLKPRVTR